MFATVFLTALLSWRARGERLIIFWDTNEHILQGPLCKLIMEKLDMVEATSKCWSGTEPNTHIQGREPIDVCMHTRDIEMVSSRQKSFHRSVGDHRTLIINFLTRSLIDNHEHKGKPPPLRRLNTRNRKATKRYLQIVEKQMDMHKLEQRQ